ncbi:MAG: glycosyltransferase [Cyanobacteria bacterium P01_F01_bin.150]
MPRISVIIPLYNAEKTIEGTLQSVFNQTVDDIEIIIINDGSTDLSLQKIKAINDPRLQVYSFKNAGASVSRNRGFAKSSGELISFLDADDQWTPSKLQDQMSALDSHPDAGVAYSWTEFIDEADHVIVKGRAMTVKTRQEAYQRLLVSNFLDNGSNPLIRREAIAFINGFNESLQACQDNDFYLRLAMHYAFVTVPKYQIKYRLSSTSMTADTSKWEKNSLAFLELAFATAPVSLQPLKKKRLTDLYRNLMLRSLEGEPCPQKSWRTCIYLAKTLWYGPSLAKQQTSFFLTVLLKSIIGLVTPSPIAKLIFQHITSRRQRQIAQYDRT